MHVSHCVHARNHFKCYFYLLRFKVILAVVEFATHLIEPTTIGEEMDHITITCPSCEYTDDVDRSRITARVKSISCPKCKIFFSPESMAGFTPLPSAEIIVEEIQQERAEPRNVTFTFTGNAREYFGIWVVNTLLKILTLGLYSPWAKVRKRKYFYGNTHLDDANFDYLADPIVLLKGWLIGMAFFVAYSASSHYSPTVSMIIGLLIFFLVPWVIVRSKLFSNRNTTHRNIRFDFNPDYSESYTVYVWLPIVSVFTLGLLAPYVFYRQKKFLMGNNRFGRALFGFDAEAKDFYMIALKAFLIMVLVVAIVGALFAFLVPQFGDLGAIEQQIPPSFSIFFPALFMGAYLMVIAYAYVSTVNLSWNGTFIGGGRFVSSMRVRDMVWILFTNMVASILSVGLLIPWATIRLAKYRLEHLALHGVVDLDAFVNSEQQETSAVGEEIGEVFDMDFGI